MSTNALASEPDAVHVGNLHDHSMTAAFEPFRDALRLDAASVLQIRKFKGYSRDSRRLINDLELRFFAQPWLYVAE